MDAIGAETGDLTDEGSALGRLRARMFVWRARFLGLGFPVWALFSLLPAFLPAATASWVIPAALGAQVLFLGLAVAAWRALYLFAREAAGQRYALGQLALSIVVTPVIGLFAIPLLVDSDVRKGFARWRRATQQPLWLVAVSTLLVFCLLLCAVALVSSFGLWGLVGATLVLPAVYRGFVVGMRRVRSG